MKTVLKLLAGLFSLSVIGVAIIYFIYPGQMLSTVQSLSASNAGLVKKSLSIDGYVAHYYETGEAHKGNEANLNDAKPSLVLLHGLNEDKNTFITSVRGLGQKYHIVLPDLPAHGENKRSTTQGYSIQSQAQFIHDLVGVLGIKRLVIGGNSLGGHISASFAADYADRTLGLVLINAGGMQIDDEPVYEPYPAKVDIAYLKNYFEQAYVTPPAYPAPLLQHLVNTLNSNIPFLNRLIHSIETGADYRINEKAHSIKASSLLLWGEKDPIIPSAYGQLYADNIKDSQLVIINNAGHAPQFEVPEHIQLELSKFMEKVTN